MRPPENGGAPAGEAGATRMPGRQDDRTACRRQCGAMHRAAYARAAGRALDLLLYGPRKQPDPRPACRAALAHLKGEGLWSEASARVLAGIVEDWRAGR